MTEEQYAIDYLKKYIETDMMYENRHYKQIELVLNLIQKQDTEINKLNNVIDRTTKYIEELTGSCPYDTFDYQVRDCQKECKDQMAECWKEYFMKEKLIK